MMPCGRPIRPSLKMHDGDGSISWWPKRRIACREGQEDVGGLFQAVVLCRRTLVHPGRGGDLGTACRIERDNERPVPRGLRQQDPARPRRSDSRGKGWKRQRFVKEADAGRLVRTRRAIGSFTRLQSYASSMTNFGVRLRHDSTISGPN